MVENVPNIFLDQIASLFCEPPECVALSHSIEQTLPATIVQSFGTLPSEMEANQFLLPFDTLPVLVREEIFMHLESTDLNECQIVNTSWRDFIVNTVKKNKSYLHYISEHGMEATRRRVFGKIVNEGAEVNVDTIWMLASCDEAEKTLYTLTEPFTGIDWPLKQYSCIDGLREVKAVTLVTSHFLNSMHIVAGHLVIFKHPMPAVLNVASIPWGGRLPIENCMQLPGDSFHFTKLLLGKDCLFLVSKNAHITWESVYDERVIETKHQEFEHLINRPVVVHRLTKESGTWREVAKLYPEHEFRVMERFPNIPGKECNPKYKDQTCLLYLSNNIITERHMLVSCPLHGSYQMFDYRSNFAMWKLNLSQLPFENIRSILRKAPNNSSEVLAAIRSNYVLIYAEEGMATLVSVRDGRIMFQVKGWHFVLSNRYVLPVEVNVFFKTARVVDSITGSVSPAFTLPLAFLSTEAHGDRPWLHDDNVYGDLENIARQLLINGSPKFDVFQLKAVSYRDHGHAMLDSHRVVYWERQRRPFSSPRYRIAVGKVHLDEAMSTNSEPANEYV